MIDHETSHSKIIKTPIPETCADCVVHTVADEDICIFAKNMFPIRDHYENNTRHPECPIVDLDNFDFEILNEDFYED